MLIRGVLHQDLKPTPKKVLPKCLVWSYKPPQKVPTATWCGRGQEAEGNGLRNIIVNGNANGKPNDSQHHVQEIIQHHQQQHHYHFFLFKLI